MAKQEMPPIMTHRRKKVKLANTGTNSTTNGKQTPWFTIGGDRDGSPSIPEFRVGSPWNAGRCFPRKRYKN